MTGNKKAVLMGLCLLLVAGAAVRALCAGREGFTGSLVKNPDEYLLDAELEEKNRVQLSDGEQ